MRLFLLATLISIPAFAQMDPTFGPNGTLSERIYIYQTIEAGQTNATVHRLQKEHDGPSYNDIKMYNKMFAPKEKSRPILDRTR